MFLSLRSGLSVISRGVIAGAQQSYNRILKLFPTVSSQAPTSTRPVQQGQVCELDGVDDYILSSELIRPDLDVEIIFKVNSASGAQKAIFGGGVGSVRFYAQYNEYNGGTLHVVVGAYQSPSALNSLTGVSENVWHTLRMQSNGDWYLNNVFQSNVGDAVTTTPSNTSQNKLNIGRRGDSTGTHSNVSIASFSVIDGGDLSTQYNLNHASGTTAYDSSGNGNDGTLQNGAAFVVDNTLPPEADKLNLEGYTDDSGVLKPRDESDPTNDIDGNPLQYSGSVYPRRPEYRNSYAASFDGVDDKILIDGTPYASKTKGKIAGYFKTASSALVTICAFTDESDTASDLRILLNSGKLQLAIRDNVLNSFNASTVATFNDGDWHLVEISCTDSGITLAVDGDVQAVTYTAGNATTVKWINDVDDVDMFAIGVRQESSPDHYFDGEIADITLFDEDGTTVIAHYPLAEGAGDTVYDISGNDNHGTINNASTATEGAGFWAGRIDGEDNALNNNNGFSKRMLFDGVDDEVELNVSPNELVETGVFDMSVEIVWDSSKIASYGRFLWFMTAGGFFRLQRDSNTSTFRLWARQGAGLDIIPKTGFVISADTNHVIRLVGNGVSCMIYLDGSLINTVTMNTANFHTPTWSKVSLGDASTTGFKGTIYNWSLITSSITQQLNGYGNTDADWTDQSGNGNDGTVNGSPALLRIPADTSEPTKDVFGDTLTNPAITDGYNGAETELDAYNIAEGDNPSPATNNNPDLDAIEFGADFASNDAAYMRLKSSTENDRLITFEDDLTGDDKELVEKFTETP